MKSIGALQTPCLLGFHEASRSFAKSHLYKDFVKHLHIYTKKMKCVYMYMYLCTKPPGTFQSPFFMGPL